GRVSGPADRCLRRLVRPEPHLVPAGAAAHPAGVRRSQAQRYQTRGSALPVTEPQTLASHAPAAVATAAPRTAHAEPAPAAEAPAAVGLARRRPALSGWPGVGVRPVWGRLCGAV